MSSQVVIVTGAASGLGAAIAFSFAELHAGLCIVDIDEKKLHETSIRCEGVSKNKVLKVIADIRAEEDLENIVKSALNGFGKIDVLINCAGIYETSSLLDSDIIEKFDKIIGTNLRSVVAMTKKALPALIESKGCIINISSVTSSLILKDCIIYALSKAGVTNFTKCAAMELASVGVRVNCISPGPVLTNILKNVVTTEQEEDEAWKNFIDMTPLKKTVKAEDLAALAIYLASDKAASITGSEFFIDGGMLLGTLQDSAPNTPN